MVDNYEKQQQQQPANGTLGSRGFLLCFFMAGEHGFAMAITRNRDHLSGITTPKKAAAQTESLFLGP